MVVVADRDSIKDGAKRAGSRGKVNIDFRALHELSANGSAEIRGALRADSGGEWDFVFFLVGNMNPTTTPKGVKKKRQKRKGENHGENKVKKRPKMTA